MDSIAASRLPCLRTPQAASSEPPTRDSCEETATPDEQLLWRVRNGDIAALGLLFHRYEQVVRGVSRRILRDASEAEDLVQDLFLFIQRKCSIFDASRSSAGSWIIQMAYQRAIERRRHLAARHFYNRADLQSTAGHVVGIPTTEHDYSAEAVFGRNGLEKIISELSEPQRETLRLHFFEGYSFAEIGEKLRQNVGNVRNHYYRGLDKLRRAMIGSSLGNSKRRDA